MELPESPEATLTRVLKLTAALSPIRNPKATRLFLMQRLDQGATKETCRELLATIWQAD